MTYSENRRAGNFHEKINKWCIQDRKKRKQRKWKRLRADAKALPRNRGFADAKISRIVKKVWHIDDY